MTPIEVLIAIQARSTSTRFPRKIFEKIGDRRVLDHVIDQALSAADHVQRHTTKLKIRCSVAVLHPEDDTEIPKEFANPNVRFIAGPEHDVLTRFVKARKEVGADFVVRLTSDCPFTFPYIITKHINATAFSTFDNFPGGPIDYMSNIDESCRTVADGLDCEIMSTFALAWLDKNAKSAFDREHVTTAIRRLKPDRLRQAFVAMHLDTAEMKLSVDTPQDLEHMREYYHRREHKMRVARRAFGNAVYEL
jgi:spore coat polysaccharide biosynthesis protein SpsF